MKKLFVIAMMSLVSAFAIAGDMKSVEQSPRFSSQAASSASEAPADAVAPTALEKGAAKVGSFVGGMLKTPMMLGKALGSGIKAGINGQTAATSESQESANASAPKMEQARLNPLHNVLGLPLKVLVRRTQKDSSQPPAPIEERSTAASDNATIASTMF